MLIRACSHVLTGVCHESSVAMALADGSAAGITQISRQSAIVYSVYTAVPTAKSPLAQAPTSRKKGATSVFGRGGDVSGRSLIISCARPSARTIEKDQQCIVTNYVQSWRKKLW